MGIISDVKCGRCDRRYSGLRSRCPYCGARRGKKGKHADDSDNSKAKILIGSLLILVLIVAVVVLIITNINDKSGSGENQNNEQVQGDDSLVNDDNVTGNQDNIDSGNEPGGDASGNDTNTGDGETGTGGDAETGGDGNTASGGDNDSDDQDDDNTTTGGSVTTVSITSIYSSGALTDFTMSVGDEIQLSCETVPAETTAKAVWSSDSTSVFTVTSDGLVKAVGSGMGTLTVKIGGATAECIVRVN